MSGNIANSLAIVAGALVGTMLKMGIGEKYKTIVMNAMGLSIVLVGLQMALKSQNILVLILALTIGGLIGEFFNIDGLMNRFGELVTEKAGDRFGDVGKAMVNASLVFCIGAMAIVGSIEEGLTGNASILYAKAMLDGIISIVFAASMGIGTALSALLVFLYQGSMTLGAGLLENVVTKDMIAEISGTGGLLILAIGTNMLKMTDIKLANFLPALPLAAILMAAGLF